MSVTSRMFLDDLAVQHPHDPVGLAADPDVVRDDQEGQPCSSLSRRIRATISSAFSLSRSPVGSSAQTIAGSLTSERAIVTRWRCRRTARPGTCVGPVGEPDQLERLERLRAGPPCGRRRDEQRQLDVLDRGQHRHQVVELEDEAHAAGAIVGALAVGHRRRATPLDQDLAVVDRVEAGEAVEQRRLAAAARAHDRDHLAALRERHGTSAWSWPT